MTPTRGTESERRTRKSRIDPRLKAWGWQIATFDPAKPLSKYTRHAIEEYPTANGPADYALVVDGQILAVVEAKKVTLGPQNVLTQAERYSKGLAESPVELRAQRVHQQINPSEWPGEQSALMGGLNAEFDTRHSAFVIDVRA